MTTLVPLIESYRGGTLENQHFGAVAVTDAQGPLLAHAGDPHWLTFTRSTLKPFQALPLLQAGAPARFGFTSRQLAMACASHNGEPVHVQEVQGMLDRIGLPVAALQCGCHVPLYAEAGVAPVPPAGSYDQRHHNCSGKHAGFLSWCVLNGQPTGSYLAPGHPLQQAVRREVAQVMGLAAQELRAGVDGCSAPNYAVPLSRLARAYARLASGARDPVLGPSLQALSQAMTAHPELVSGAGRSDLALMRAGRGDWIAKVGADGVQAVGSASRGQAFAIKVIDGNRTALVAATVAVMDQLGWLDARQKEELRPWRSEAIANARGTRVGERRAVLRLKAGS